MSAAAQRQAVPAAPSAVASSSGLMVLRRSCRCNSGDSAPEREDEAWRSGMLQRKLAIGATDDPLEREADLVAARVLAAPQPADAPLRIRRHAATSAGPAVAPPSVQAALDGPGVPIEPAVREDMELRIGHDFAHVRVHLDPIAARSASEVNAHAYTVGRHIVFGPGRYAPRCAQGRALLAHELAHVVQQSGSATPAVQRAVMQLGELTISIDYGNVATVAPADRPDRIIVLATNLTGSAPDAAQETTIRALSSTAQVWLMFALDLLEDNRAAATGLDKAVAVQRLLNHAPGAANKPLPDPDRLFVREALSVSGWSETALAERLPAPGAAKRKKVREIVNPTPTSGSATDPLDVAALKKRLPPALKHLLKTIDPAKWTSVGKRSISAFQKLGDIVQAEARTFFAPYANTAIGNLYDLKPAWHASANIFDVGAIAPGRDMRLGYLRNRAEIVGRSDATSTAISDANIFADVNFDPTRTADDAELFAIIDDMEKDKAVQPIVDRLIQHTGRQSGSGAAATIGLVTEFNAAKTTACKDHWQGIDTLCHEVLHALAHPKFVATARKVSFPQVIREGFTEVLGVQLFNDGVVPKAASDATFKAGLEAGVSGAPCPAPAKATIGYGAAGAGAETIRNEVKDDRFRAAYFLGRPDLAGLPT